MAQGTPTPKAKAQAAKPGNAATTDAKPKTSTLKEPGTILRILYMLVIILSSVQADWQGRKINGVPGSTPGRAQKTYESKMF